MWNKETEYQICWHFREWRQCGFISSAYVGTNVPINVRTAGVETRKGFSYSVTQQPYVITWQHSSLKPVSSYCKSKYGRTTQRKAACRVSDARRFALNDEIGTAFDINFVLKTSYPIWTELSFLTSKKKKKLVSRNRSSRAIYRKLAEKKTGKKRILPNMVKGGSALERHEES